MAAHAMARAATTIVQTENGKNVASNVRTAERMIDRLRGLLGTPELGPEDGLWIEPCGSIHTLGMKFRIDVAFLSRSGCVLRTRAAVAPGRVALAPARSTAVVELAEGRLRHTGIEPGERLVRRADGHQSREPHDA